MEPSDEPPKSRRFYWFAYCFIYLASFGWFTYRQGLLSLWQSDRFAPALSDVAGAAIGVALTLVIILELGVAAVVLFAPALIERWINKGREEARREYEATIAKLEEGLKEARREAHHEYQAAIANLETRIKELEDKRNQAG